MIFTKKIKITELFNNAVDIHNHILPAIDDGAKDLNYAVDLVNEYKALGYSKIIATPHTMSDYYPNTSTTINDALTLLNEELNRREIHDISIKAASEYMLDGDFETKLDANKPLLTYRGNKVLVEMSYLRESENLNELLYKLQLKNYQPILAHPERYVFYLDKLEKIYNLKNNGVQLQVNMLALTNHYGSKIQKVAKKLLEADMYDYIGIDTHRMGHLKKVREIKISSKIAGKINLLLENNKDLY